MKIFVGIAILLVGMISHAGAATTIEWWQFWTDPDIKPVIEAMVSEFEHAHPDIKVNITDLTWANGHEKIVIAFASGTGPDVIELGSDWIAQFAANGQLADISDHIASDSDKFQGWDMATYQGKVYAKPWILGTRVLFCNRDLLTKAGYDTNWVPIRMPEFKVAAKRIALLGKDIYGWGSNTAEKHRLYKKFLPFFWSFGAQIFTDDNKYCVFSSERGIGALKFYKALHDSAGYVANQRGIEDAFLDGKIGFIFSGDWLLKRIEKEHRKLNFFTTLFPGTFFPGKSFLGGEFLAVNNDSKHKEAALQFIDFITSPENQVRFCKANRSANPSSIEAQKDSYFTSNINLQTFIKQINSAKHPPVDPDWVYIEDIIEQAVENALFNSMLPAEAMREARDKIAEIKKRR